MVAYHEVEHAAIFESYVSGRPLQLKQPDSTDGPGCIHCGLHWMIGRNEPCEPPEEESDG